MTVAHVSHNSGNNEWYTSPEIIEAVREGMGGIWIDPASHFVAQKKVRAVLFFTAEEDGLLWPWVEPSFGDFLDEDAYVTKYTEGCRQSDLFGVWYSPHMFRPGTAELRSDAVGFTEDELREHYREGIERGYRAFASGGWFDEEALEMNRRARERKRNRENPAPE